MLASSTAVGTFSWEHNYYVFQNFVRASDLENRNRLVICCYINVLDFGINQAGTLSTALDSREENTEAPRAENEFKKEEVTVSAKSSLYAKKACRKNCKRLNYLKVFSFNPEFIGYFAFY